MYKRKLSKRERDRRLKVAVEKHVTEIEMDNSNSSTDSVSNNIDFKHNIDAHFDNFSDHTEYSSISDFNISSSSIYDDSINGTPSTSKQQIESDRHNELRIDTFITELKSCFLKHNATHAFINDMLCVLNKYWDLPKDARTLLETPTTLAVSTISDGEYVHFGLKLGIEQNLKLEQFKNINSFSLLFNVDGLPLFKSSSHQFWPILCRIPEMSFSKPFIVGIFYGHTKPTNVNDFLGDFIFELQEVLENPIFNGKSYSVTVNAFICDAPARSFVKCIKNHNGYYGCERCIQKGKWIGRMTFPEIDSPLRKNEDFKKVAETHSTNEHIISISPLLNLNIDLVNMFPLDYMHLVCLGVVRKLILSWLRGPLSVRIGSNAKRNLNENLIACAHFCPKEFQRKPRSTIEIDRWKATEFRSFLLYTGPVVLKDVLSRDYYNHFLCLHLAIRIMLSEKLIADYLGYARELLVYFVKVAKKLYGEEFLVYNVHALIHLPEDVEKFGSLNNINAFPFESYLHTIKKLLRTPHKPLQQLYKRVLEKKQCTDFPNKNREQYVSLTPVYSTLHYNGPTLNLEGQQYKEVEGFNFTLRTCSGDNCFMLKSGRIVLAHNFIVNKNEIFVIGQYFQQKMHFYQTPCNSSEFGIILVSNLSSLNYWPLNNFLCKGILMPFRKHNVFSYLIHCYDNFF